MTVLGLSYDFHDASAAVISSQGRLCSAAAEERYTLLKHDASFPKLATRACLALGGVSVGDLDTVAFYEQPPVKFTRVLQDTFDRFPRGGSLFAASMRSWLGDKLWQRRAVARELGVNPRKVAFFPHHISHAAQAFCISPFSSAAVLVVDGVGEWGSTTLLSASRDPLEFKVLEEFDYPQSLGLVYAAFTAFLGFKPNSGEASVMALAAFGRPRYTDRIEQVLKRLPDDSYQVEAKHFDFLGSATTLFRQSFCDIFGSPRDFRRRYPFDALNDDRIDPVDAEDQYHADLAASLQTVLTDVLLGLCRRLQAATDSRSLCVAGGVAMNCLANTELLRHAGFDHLFIPPDPGDGGAAVGAAFLGRGKAPVTEPATPYLGSDIGEELVSDLLDEDYLLHIAREAVPSNSLPKGIAVQHCQDESALVEAVAADLHAGCIVGWVQGRCELGPRALGNRSLLVDPANVAAVRRMSSLVKSHVHFRPYALSIAAESAHQVIECEYLDQSVLRWMQTIWPVRPEVRQRLRGGVHVDGTTRPQICSAGDNLPYWRLLHSFASYSGLPVLLNTSLNERSMPMVSSGVMALATFLRTGIDTLALGQWVLRKR